MDRSTVFRSVVVAVLVSVAAAVFFVAGRVTSEGTESGAGASSLDHLIESGEMQEMFVQHQAMMERMRAGVDAAHLREMDDDPMWRLMRTGEFAELMEEHQAQLDRMLADDD